MPFNVHHCKISQHIEWNSKRFWHSQNTHSFNSECKELVKLLLSSRYISGNISKYECECKSLAVGDTDVWRYLVQGARPPHVLRVLRLDAPPPRPITLLWFRMHLPSQYSFETITLLTYCNTTWSTAHSTRYSLITRAFFYDLNCEMCTYFFT